MIDTKRKLQTLRSLSVGRYMLDVCSAHGWLALVRIGDARITRITEPLAQR